MPPAEPLPEFDLYAELGIEPGSTVEEVIRRYRAAIRREHPDVAAGAGSAGRAARLNIARDWLTEPTRRARYDLVHVPRLRVEIPQVDPLGTWPDRQAPPPNAPNVAAPIASVSLAVVVWMLVVGVASSYLTVTLFTLGIVLLVFFGLLSIAGLFRRP